jgi:isoquinoline 1-oxidoreductase beta subunit
MPHRAVEAVAVVADTYWAALKARKALKIQWDAEGSDKTSTDAYYANLRQLAQKDGIDYPEKVGDFKGAFQKATKKLEASYETPFLAHAPLEPENATVWVQGDKVEVWAPIQHLMGLFSNCPLI